MNTGWCEVSPPSTAKKEETTHRLGCFKSADRCAFFAFGLKTKEEQWGDRLKEAWRERYILLPLHGEERKIEGNKKGGRCSSWRKTRLLLPGRCQPTQTAPGVMAVSHLSLPPHTRLQLSALQTISWLTFISFTGITVSVKHKSQSDI